MSTPRRWDSFFSVRGPLIRGKKYFASRIPIPVDTLTSIGSSNMAFFSHVSMNGRVTVALSAVSSFVRITVLRMPPHKAMPISEPVSFLDHFLRGIFLAILR